MPKPHHGYPIPSPATNTLFQGGVFPLRRRAPADFGKTIFSPNPIPLPRPHLLFDLLFDLLSRLLLFSRRFQWCMPIVTCLDFPSPVEPAIRIVACSWRPTRDRAGTRTWCL